MAVFLSSRGSQRSEAHDGAQVVPANAQTHRDRRESPTDQSAGKTARDDVTLTAAAAVCVGARGWCGICV